MRRWCVWSAACLASGLLLAVPATAAERLPARPPGAWARDPLDLRPVRRESVIEPAAPSLEWRAVAPEPAPRAGLSIELERAPRRDEAEPLADRSTLAEGLERFGVEQLIVRFRHLF